MAMQYDAGVGDLANWVVAESRFEQDFQGKCEAVLCQGNGYLGIRAATEEPYLGQVRNTFIAGTFNRFDESEVTELPNAPDVVRMDIRLDGSALDLTRGSVRDYVRRLNLRNGELTRSCTWTSAAGLSYELTFRRFVSFANKHLVVSRVDITPLSADARIAMRSGLDGQCTNSGTQHFAEGEKRIYDETFVKSVQTTTQSGIEFVVLCSHEVQIDGEPTQLEPTMALDRRQAWLDFEVSAKNGQTLSLTKTSVYFTSNDKEFVGDGEAMHDQALAQLKSLHATPYESLLAESSAVWDEFWHRADIEIDGPGFDQLAVRFAMYHLAIMTPFHDARFGIASKGLSGEGYKGHSFWDSEIFVLPFFHYVNPDQARQLLEYRYRTIDGARRKARDNGYRGAMYAWESADTGDEVTPVWGAVDIVTGERTKIWSGFIEQHITADIAYAIWTYHRITGDEAFMREMGYEMLFETATFWCSRLEWLEDRRQWGIRDVIGPDEYKEHVDNNAFTNHLAEHNIRLAIRSYETLKETAPEVLGGIEAIADLEADYRLWLSRVEDIYLPAPRPEDGVIPQDDTYLQKQQIDLTEYKEQKHVGRIFHDYNLDQVNAMQVSKQADVLALFLLLRHRFTRKQLLANWAYYEPRTLHDSSLSLSSHVLLAVEVGDLDLAYEFFERARAIDLGPDMASSDSGIHAASLGGLWQCVVNGFGGVATIDNDLHIHPKLPPTWNSLRFKILWHGREIAVHATRGSVVIEASPSDPPFEAIVCGERRMIAGKATSHG